MRLAARVLAAVAASAFIGACFSYRALAGAPPRPGSTLRVQLTDSGSVALREYLGPNVVAVVGEFRDRTPSGMQLAVESTELPSGEPVPWTGELVTIPGSLIALTQERHVSASKTALVASGIAAIAVGTGAALSGVGKSSGARRTPPGPH